jgi:hypothetical protein
MEIEKGAKVSNKARVMPGESMPETKISPVYRGFGALMG